MTLQDFSDCPVMEPIRVRAKGLLERRGSNASLTIDLGSNSNLAEAKPPPSFNRLNAAKSVSNLNLSTFGATDKSCMCLKKCELASKIAERRKSQEACERCTIYESVPSKSSYHTRCQNLKRCNCCARIRRKSLSNENLYVPPGHCMVGMAKECTGNGKHCKGYRKAYYPRQPDLESTQLLSEDFKLHLQNTQYLQTAGNMLSVEELQQACEVCMFLRNTDFCYIVRIHDSSVKPNFQLQKVYKAYLSVPLYDYQGYPSSTSLCFSTNTFQAALRRFLCRGHCNICI